MTEILAKQIKWLIGEMTIVQHDLEHDNLNKDLAGMQNNNKTRNP